MKNNILIEKIEKFYSEVTSVLIEKHGKYYYKNVYLSEIAIKFYLNQFINSTDFFNKISAISSDEEWKQFIKSYASNFEVKTSFFNKISFIIFDCIRYFVYLFSSSIKFSKADIYIFITNKKFINYTKTIRLNLENKGVKVGLLIWEPKDITPEIQSISTKPKIDFPHFWTRKYFQFRPYAHLVDRVLGYKSCIDSKKVLLVEGCVLAEHIVGEVCKSLKVNSTVLQWGFFAKTVTQSGWRQMPFDKFIVWGDFYKNSFGEYNDLKIVSCGHPTLDYSSRFDNKTALLFAVQKVMGDHIVENDILKFIDFAISYARKFPNKKIIIRSHPDFKIPERNKEETHNQNNIIWHDYYNFSLKQSFEEAKFCISVSSTVSLESIAFGCYPVFLKTNELPLQVYEVFSSKGDFEHVFDYKSFEDGIAKLDEIDLKEYIKELNFDFYKTLGNEAIESIVNELIN